MGLEPFLEIRKLGCIDYVTSYEDMQDFTSQRLPDQRDQLWICEHYPVYTQGLAGRPEHLLAPGHIPVVASNRGGQATYHGPGQVVAYPLVDLRRAGYYVKEYVYRIEEALLRTLAHFGVTGHRVAGAPGVYVRLDDPFSHAIWRAPQSPEALFQGLGKIAALGIKLSRHCTYHGLALNVAMDLAPYLGINPCGHAGLRAIDLSTIGVHTTWDEAADVLASKLSVFLTP